VLLESADGPDRRAAPRQTPHAHVVGTAKASLANEHGSAAWARRSSSNHHSNQFSASWSPARRRPAADRRPPIGSITYARTRRRGWPAGRSCHRLAQPPEMINTRACVFAFAFAFASIGRCCPMPIIINWRRDVYGGSGRFAGLLCLVRRESFPSCVQK